MSSDVRIDGATTQAVDEAIHLVVLAFARTAKPLVDWHPVIEAISPTIRVALNETQNSYETHLPSRQYLRRYLDHDEATHTARIAQLDIPVVRKGLAENGTSDELATLAGCTALSHMGPLKAFEQEFDVQLVIQPSRLLQIHRQAGLAVFDMDSTLIQQEVIDELARAVGLYDQVAAITEAAMRGEAPYTDFEASLRARVALLKGVPTSIWEQLKKDVITFTPGAKELIKCLRKLGWKTAVLSGGFTPLALWVKETLGLDYAFANHLVSDAEVNTLSGELVAEMPIIHASKKRELLLQLAEENNIPLERTIAVGDGSNDLLMMGAAGLGIAFNAKPKVQLAAPARLNGDSLLDVMYILGFAKSEVDDLLAR